MMGRYGSMNIFRCPRESDVQAVKDAIERVDLTDHLSTPIGNLSRNYLFNLKMRGKLYYYQRTI